MITVITWVTCIAIYCTVTLLKAVFKENRKINKGRSDKSNN